MSTPFGRRIKEQRHRRGLSLRKVCEAVLNEERKPISVSYLNDIEQGHRNPPDGRIVIQLASVLQINEDQLLALAQKPDPRIAEAIKKDKEVGVLFRRVLDDPGLMEKVRKLVKDKPDASG